MKTIYSNLMTDGIMSDLADFNVPWHDFEQLDLLDMGYYSHSANKLVSPILFDFAHTTQNQIVQLTTEQRTKIAGMVFTIYNRKWSKLWNVLSVEYNPINNYDMVEEETVNHTIENEGSDTGTVTNAHTGTISNQETHTGTLTNGIDKEKTNTGTQTNNDISSSDDSLYGFNSSSSVPSDSNDSTINRTRTDNLVESEDTTETETRNLTDTNTQTLNNSDTETNNLSHANTETKEESRSLSRSGNIGVTTTQQMLTSEIELWQWNFYKQVFDDIDSLLCLDVY